MSHHVTLQSLVLEYKRATEGKGINSSSTMAAIIGTAVGIITPLPDLGPHGESRAKNELLVPAINLIGSDATELLPFDTSRAFDVAVGIYVNRYHNAWGRERCLESFSIREIITGVFGDEAWSTLVLWMPRFVEAVLAYYRERLNVEG